MTRKILFALAAILVFAGGVTAQRYTDVLGRGLVAMKTDNGVFCSWRINADEWNGTQYNIYRGSTKLNSTPLNVSNFTDASGTLSSTYTVRPVKNGVEGDASSPVTVWEKNYTIITPQHAPEISAALVPNDATVADVDGDGDLEIIMKYDNTASSYSKGDNGIFTVVECLEMDGSVKWWINFGPNIGDFQNNEINIIAYDWDLDGKAEVVFRAADGTVIHQADGTTYTVGDASINYRSGDNFPDGQWFMHWGKEYLVYADGLTGKPYECIDYPLKRVEDANNPNNLLSGSGYDTLVNNEWGDGYGHRSSKYFFAAPYLDGRKPSLFLSRGIYTKHKMITYDIDPVSHKLVERWRWNDLGGEWFGQGYHNMGIADVDWDGRDEIVYGSIVIDDNGYGLSTVGLGHGDSQHCGDFDPYSHGQEIFACNEDNPNNNFRDATTSKIYYRTISGSDDGRANMGNFIDEYPGAEGVSSHDDALIGGASHKAIVGDRKANVSITQNFRVYWDGDLCDESFDYRNGKNSAGAIYKAREGQIAVLEGSLTNNDTKGTPCFQGDILGDWREEYIMRDGSNNIRIYSTNIPTENRIYSLWYDHQYRNAMVWQMCGYNQTPHVSFYLSNFEDITVPPAPLTMTGRTEVADNGVISASLNDKHVVVCETGDMTISAAAGVSPEILTVNTPTWVEGHNNNNNITTKTYTHTITEGSFAGDMKLVKQGDGKLVMPTGTHTYSGKTEVWAGTIALDGELTNSEMWLNRFAVLETSSLNLPKGLDMEYASVLRIGSDSEAGEFTTGELTLGFGSILELDLFADETIDKVSASKLIIEKKDWANGPEYLQPIVKFTSHPAAGETTLPSGKYLIGEFAEIEGDLSDLIMIGVDDMKKEFVYEDGKLYISVQAYQPGVKIWSGSGSTTWDLDHSLSFKNDGSGADDVFVPGDEVIFDDSAVTTDIEISGRLKPASVTFKNNEKDYTLSGDGEIVGDAKLVKEGAGKLTINNINSYTGGTYINGGRVVAGVFSNNIGTDLGAFSDVDKKIYMSNGATLEVSATGTLGQNITISNGNATLDVPAGITLTTSKGVSGGGIGQILYKKGNGTLNLNGGSSVTRLVIDGGAVNSTENSSSQMLLPSTVEFVSGTLYDSNSDWTYTTNSSNFYVGEGNSGTIYLDPRCNYTGKLTGSGQFTVYAAGIRNYLNGDWSGFEGDIIASQQKRGSYDPDFTWNNSFGMPKASLSISTGVTFNAQGFNVTLGALRGSGTYYGTGTLTIGNDDKTISFAGKFSGNPQVIKVGKCDMQLSKLMTDVKSLTVRGGTLSLMASSSPYNTVYLTSPLNIEGNAKLRGRGTVESINVSGNGVVEPGSYSDSNPYHYGPIFSTGNVTFNPGSTLSLYLRVAGKSNDCSYLDVAGTLTINGDVKVEMYSGYEPAAGDQFQLWKTNKFSGNPNIELPELPAGLEWDYTGLTDATGILKVKTASGVTDIAADAIVNCRVVATTGVVVKEFTTTMSEVMNECRSLDRGVYVVTVVGEGIARSFTIRI